MDFLLFLLINIILLCCVISGITLFIYMINQLSKKNFQIAFNCAITVFTIFLIFNNSSSLYENKFIQKEVTRETITENYVNDIQHIQTKSSGYNNYRLLNIKNGNIIRLQENEFVKLKCENFSVISYNISREYTFVGIKIDFDTDNIEYKVNCI